MRRGDDDTFTTINATGTVEGAWGTVGFNLTVRATAKTGPKAKEAIRPSATKIEAAIEALRAEGVEIKSEDIKATYGVDKAVEYDGRVQKFAGYTCTYTCSFATKTVDEASRVHDKLTSLGDDVECDSPTFAIAKEDNLREAALKAAWESVQAQISQLCAACNQDEGSLTVTSINVGDDRGGGFRAFAVAASASPKGGAAPIKLSGGKPQVSVTLTVSYDN